MDRDGRRDNRVQRGWLDGAFALVLLGACLVQFVLVEVHRGTSWQLWTALYSNLWREKTHGQVVKHELVAAAERRADEAPVEQPDDVRRRAGRENTPELFCSAARPLLPQSTTLTAEGVVTTVTAAPAGDGKTPAWRYTVEFRNAGPLTVQLLTRHWVFVDARGGVHEIKGPGVIGATPILSQGEVYSYQSGTKLPTVHGSMYGSFQFEVLASPSRRRPEAGGSFWDDYSPGAQFNAPVNRLALLSTGRGPGSTPGAPCPRWHVSEQDPTVEPSNQPNLLSCTSISSAQRVIVGATAEFEGFRKESSGEPHSLPRHRFRFDVQINNARTEPVTFFAHHWRFVANNEADPKNHGMVVGEASGVGIGGDQRIGVQVIRGGGSLRFITHYEFSPPAAAGSEKGDHGSPVRSMIASGFFDVVIGDRQHESIDDIPESSLFKVEIGELSCREKCN